MTVALIDGDVLVYSVGYASNEVSRYQAEQRLLRTLGSVINATQASSYKMFLSDSKGNFRNTLFPLYKGNRTAPKPTHYEHLQNVILSNLHGEVAFGEEADDALGICAEQYENCIIASNDKDLFQIPGRHYNIRTGSRVEICEQDSQRSFWSQVLTGDSADNIVPNLGLSCPGVGSVRAAKILNEVESTGSRDIYRRLVLEYALRCRKSKGSGINKTTDEYLYSRYDIFNHKTRLDLTAKLVKIRRKPNEIWEPPELSEKDLENINRDLKKRLQKNLKD